MNAVNQYVDVYKNWADGQIKTGQSWFEAMQELKDFNPGLIFDKTIDAYEASVRGTLDAEVAGAKIWFEEVVPVKSLPQPAVDLAKQMQETTKQITDMQQSVADNYFGMIRKIDVKGLPLAEAPKNAAPKKVAKKA